MPRRPALHQCNRVVAKGLPHLSKPGAACLALGGLGMTLARPCSLTAIALAGVPLLKLKSFTPRERLRDPCREAPAKAGTRRRTLDLSTCRAPGWPGCSRAGTAGSSPRRSMRPRRASGSSSWP